MYHFPVLKRVAGYIGERGLFRPGDRVGVAVSGGADSVALLRALLELRGDLGIVLSAVHANHGIRGPEAHADEQFVRELAERYDLAYRLREFDVPAFAAAHKLSLETAARQLRYGFFHDLLAAQTVDKIATAHTLDDQAETVLLRLLRGTGTRGLAAILPERDSGPELRGRIVRPLLAIRRVEVETYLRTLGQDWREDRTNADLRHLRNRVRRSLLPFMEREYTPAIYENLANLAEIVRAEEELWKPQVQRLLDALVSKTAGKISLARCPFLDQPLALRRRILIALSERLRLPASFREIDHLVRLAEHPGGRSQIVPGWQVTVTREALEFRAPVPPVQSSDYCYQLAIPGEVQVRESGHILRASIREASSAAGYNSATFLDLERLEIPLQVRNWQPGDRYWPAGRKQSDKLKRLFQQQRIPSPVRAWWPVVFSGDEIVWVPGFPPASGYAAQNGEAVCIEAIASDPQGEGRQT